ncbi:GDSL-type esterase/lipase family protein [Brevibacillus fulvus]|uniref:Lysophospholipase L1-like esterase n=1 Tax=Brevibacillus fulvus TaxID=1125967 RepID=A0A939BV06_9BACL|nr:GDSL-type esterase/lipase family protein [Brevibacillus fulvus]MBM7590974.1 lysophospholipase L1-like esterase [Brevibacillus fulvus]
MRVSRERLLWRSTGLAALLAFLLCLVGFALALNPFVLAPANSALPAQKQPATATPPLANNGGALQIVTLGDSLTRGTGDTNGRGYVGILRDALAKQNGTKPVINNLAISGQQSPALLEQLAQPQVKKLIAQANLIVFTIGGNDLFQQSGGLYELDKEKLAQANEQLAANFEQILKQLRQLNATATIIYPSLYNPFGDTEAAAETAPPVLDWNSTASAIAAKYPRVIVVPTYDLFVQKEQAYLYSDHFHPNSAGYIRIAERILQALQ